MADLFIFEARQPLDRSIDTGCPSIAASASIPPTPQPSTARPLTIVVWLSVTNHVSGNRPPYHRRSVLGPDGFAARYYKVHAEWPDAVPVAQREVLLKRLLAPPSRNVVKALDMRSVFAVHVHLEGRELPNSSTCTVMVDPRLDGFSGLISARHRPGDLIPSAHRAKIEPTAGTP